LEFAQQVKRPFKAVELRRMLDWPASSTQLVLQTLVDSGYLIFNNDKKQYFPSPRVMMVGAWLRDTNHELSGVFEVLDEIAAETGETVALSIENNFSAQCVAVLQGRTPIPVVIPVGMRAPLTRSAAGLATLMAKSDGQALTAVQKSRELALTDLESYSQTIQTVHRCRREGRAVVYGRLWPDSCFISVPAPKTFNRAAVTISAGGSMATMKRREDAVTEVMLAAIDRWRGHSPSMPNRLVSGRTG
jgi:DNA-binding IclR family transcriptional regulator